LGDDLGVLEPWARTRQITENPDMTNRPKVGCTASSHVERRAKVAAVCRAIVAGERLVDILRADDLPTTYTFQAWIGRSEELASMYGAAKAERRTPPRSHNETAKLYTPQLAEEFCERLALADTVEEVCAQPDMPSQSTVYRWRREMFDFAQRYDAAREVQGHRRFDTAWSIAQHARWDGWRGAKLAIDTIRWQVAHLAPESYGPKAARGADDEAFNVEVVEFGPLPAPEDTAREMACLTREPGGSSPPDQR
jgi:hypothetical protein